MNSDIKEICHRLLDGPAPPLRSSADMVDVVRRARRRRHGTFAAAGAGLAVVAVVATATAVPLVDGSGTPPESGFGAAIASTAPASPSAAPSASSVPPSRDLGREVRRVKVSQVVSEMVAKAASVQPLSIPEGQFLYVRTEGREPPIGRVHEMWLDPQGTIAVRIDINGSDTSNGPKSDMENEIATARQQFAQEGPTLRMPSPQFLAGLPTDPAVLLNMVKALNAGTKMGGAYYAFKEIGELFWENGAVLTPPVRAAFYRALGRISGVTATELRVDGRRLYALRQPDNGRGFGDELLLDPSTGQVAGRRSVATGGEVAPTDLELWRYAVVGTVGQRG